MSHLTVSFSFSLKGRLRQGKKIYTQCKNRWGREIKNKSKERKQSQGLWDDDRKEPYKGCCPASCQRHRGTWYNLHRWRLGSVSPGDSSWGLSPDWWLSDSQLWHNSLGSKTEVNTRLSKKVFRKPVGSIRKSCRWWRGDGRTDGLPGGEVTKHSIPVK